jgi:transposase
MANKDSIREMYFVKGMNIAEIAKATHRDRKTVRKLIQKQDWNLEQPKTRKERKGVLKISPYQATIDAILLEDKLSKKKQRHTAKRIYERLLEQCHQTGTELHCSYRTICLYVTRKKREIYGSQKDFMFELIHQAGEAQADFGDADFKENGKKIQGKYLVLTFPYSNAGYSLMFRGENAECLLTGLRSFFEYIGGVPNRIWFDNPSSMVTKVHKDGERTCTEEFLRFKQHYGFEAVFCNTGSGHEKGNVENKVGYIRRNFLVPIPQITSLQDFNQDLLVKCDEDQEREHYRKEVSLSHLWEEDRAKLLPLPQQPFDVCRYEHVRTNACAKFTLQQGIHTYSVTPRYANSHVLVKLTHEDVIVLDEDLREICRHPRMYGESRQESMDWIPYLSELARRPNALKYTGIYSLLPNPVQTYMDRSSKQDRGSLLKALALMNQELGFDRACQVILQAIERNIHDYDSMILLYRKLHQSLPEMKLSGIYDVPMENQVAFNTAVYDEIYPSPTTTSKETRNSSSEKQVTHA